MLAFGGPRDKIIAKINTKPKSRPASVRTPDQVSIRIGDQVINGGRSNKQTMRKSTPKVIEGYV